MEPKRILIGGFTEGRGGMETYIMDIYRHCDRTKLQFDFLNFHTFDIAYKEEIEELGGCIYYIPLKSVDMKMHYQALKQLFLENSYCGVYYQCNHKLVSLDVFKIAKKHGVKKRVVHSHNSTHKPGSFMHRLREKVTEMQFPKYVTANFACSKNAGKWMFGNREYTVIRNGIDTSVFAFHQEKREQLRREMGIYRQLVIGTVGRLVEAKNPEYMLEIFKILHEQNPNTVFLHVGDGNLRERMKKKIVEYGLQDRYLLLGMQSNVADYLCAMDIFLLPSIHEGFPFVLVEAQATGLPCLVADNITKDCDLTGNMTFISNQEQPNVWAKKIQEIDISNRQCGVEQIQRQGYDVNTVAMQIQDYFLGEETCKEQLPQ